MLRSRGLLSESSLGRYEASRTSVIIVGLANTKSIGEEVLCVVEKQE